MTQLDIDHLRQWIGREETMHDVVEPWGAAAMAATLDHEKPPGKGDALPPGWHWMLFLPHARQSELGPDGHPKRGGFLPPVPLPRRMWAGGRLRFHAPLRIGEKVSRISRIDKVDLKQGKGGALVFVVVKHRIEGPGGLALEEEHDVVYREAPVRGAKPPAPPEAPKGAEWSRSIHPDPVLLFRYSALTFNGHRIHYDRSYCAEVEGYPGLIVHGPLIATLLLDLFFERVPGERIRRFSFRAVSPLFDTAPFTVSAAGSRVWATNPTGGLAMEAEAEVAPAS
jgi:3-methylfumaryl-CoA hydratase